MRNALAGGALPPIPNPAAEAAPQAQQAPMSFSNALAMAPPQRQMPAPSHQETVAALRHFMAIVDELQALQKDPALGKTDCKMKIIDGFSKLVAERMISPANAVSQLTAVPSDPSAQRKWVQQMLQQTIAAQNSVLSHHVAAHPATLDWAQESQHQAGPMDDHMQTMDGLSAQYR